MFDLVTKKVLFSAKELLNKNHNVFPSKRCMFCAESSVIDALRLKDTSWAQNQKDEATPSVRMQNPIPNLLIFQKLIKTKQNKGTKVHSCADCIRGNKQFLLSLSRPEISFS